MKVAFHCAICFEDHTEENIGVYTCGHSFCLRCAEKWKRKHGTCPSCREKGDIVKPYLDIRLKPSSRSRDAHEPSSGELLPVLREKARKIREQADNEEKAGELAESGLDELVSAMRKEGIEIQEDVLDAIEGLKNTFVRQCNFLKEDARRVRRERDAANDTVTAQRRQIAQHDATLARVRREKIEAADASLSVAKTNEAKAISQAQEAVTKLVQLRQEKADLEEQLKAALEEVNDFKSKITRFKARTELAKKEAQQQRSKAESLEQQLTRMKITTQEPPAKSPPPPVPESSTVRVTTSTGPSEDVIYLPEEEEEEESLVILAEEEEQEDPELYGFIRPKVNPLQRTPSQRTGMPMFPSGWNLTSQSRVPNKRPASSGTPAGPLKIRNGRVQGAYDVGPKKRIKFSG